MTAGEALIRIQPTPNPNAWKFVLDRTVMAQGKATYADANEASGNSLAKALFAVEGVRQVHFFQNVITVTHNFDALIEPLHREICRAIQLEMPSHDPNRTLEDEKEASRAHLPEEMRSIEEILDRTIRPGLQGDGGDLTVVKFEDKKLYVHYEGACGTCPSATSGTLMAIEGILRDEFDPAIEVIPL